MVIAIIAILAANVVAGSQPGKRLRHSGLPVRTTSSRSGWPCGFGLTITREDSRGKWISPVGGGKPNGTDNATVNLQLSLVSNELASTKILLCPNDVRRVSATNFATISLTNVSYALCNEADEKRPRVILATDRNLSGFDFTGLPDNINCFILTSPDTGARSAKWRRGICHGANVGMVALSDGSVHQLNDSRLVQTLVGYDPATETDDGNLQFYFP